MCVGFWHSQESGFYYLNSRYYDPNLCRFINADDASLIGADGDFISYNLFAYCANNPINHYDPNGQDWKQALFFGVALIVVGVAILAVTAATGGGALALAGVAGGTAAAGSAASATAMAVGTELVVAGTAATSISVLYAKHSKQSKKEGATDKPSYANRDMVDPNQSAQSNARRIMNEKWGEGNWKPGPGSDYNKILKWIERHVFRT